MNNAADVTLTVEQPIIDLSIAGAPGKGVPSGGNTGQILVKNSNTSFDTIWDDASIAGSAGGDLTGTYPNPTLSNTTNVNALIQTDAVPIAIALGGY